jgi:transposase InsO family protein
VHARPEEEDHPLQPCATPATDLLKRDFAATAPHRLWTADITYIKTDEDLLAFVHDIHSHRIMGSGRWLLT